MRRILLVIALVFVVGLGAVMAWRWMHRTKSADELLLYGNIDLRQVELAFNNSERIATVLVQEGDRVTPERVVAEVDTSRLRPQVEQAAGARAAQAAVVERLHNGSRPEEIAQARANVDAALADSENARIHLDRLRSASMGGVSQLDVDNAKAALDVNIAKLELNRKALDLLVVGPRKEDIAQAEAELQADDAQLTLLQQQLRDAVLTAHVSGVVRSRLMEPGEMASPQRPVITIAIIDPKWVRAYVSEPDLGLIRPGMKAAVTVDSFPGRRFSGWIGFISSVAEFTPKPVQTDQLRSQLVYEVRVFVNDASDELRLGMPATVHLPLPASAAGNSQPSAGMP
jgi:HlyD family secretion protein